MNEEKENIPVAKYVRTRCGECHYRCITRIGRQCICRHRVFANTLLEINCNCTRHFHLETYYCHRCCKVIVFYDQISLANRDCTQ